MKCSKSQLPFQRNISPILNAKNISSKKPEHVVLKQWLAFTGLHSVISQKTEPKEPQNNMNNTAICDVVHVVCYK
jgi:hypothetical protein